MISITSVGTAIYILEAYSVLIRKKTHWIDKKISCYIQICFSYHWSLFCRFFHSVFHSALFFNPTGLFLFVLYSPA